MAAAGAVAMLAAALGMASNVATVPVWDTAWTVAGACALAGMIAARAGARRAGAPTGRWSWWIAATACWLAGQLAWDVFGIVGMPGTPNAADFGWWLFAAAIVGGLLAPADRPRTIRLLALVEALPLTVAVMALTCTELWDHVAASSLSHAARASALAYPVLYVTAAVLTLQAMLGGALAPTRSPGLRLVLSGAVAQAIAFIVWTADLLQESYVVGGSPVDPLWVAGLVAIGLGGAISARTPVAAPPPEHEPGRWGGVLPAAVFVLLVAALVRAELGEEPVGARLALAGGLLTCGAMLAGRGVLLSRRLRRLLERERAAHEGVAVREAELAQLNERLAEDSRRDPLTGLLNRRALAADLVTPYGAVAIALVDVDRFKAYNDRLGHLAGDQALGRLARIVRAALRAGDGAYRYGGEELLLVLRDATPAAAVAVAERVRAAVADAGLPHPDGIDGVLTVSVGVAAGPSRPGEQLAQADAALYEAKAAGRNRVVAYAPRRSASSVITAS